MGDSYVFNHLFSVDFHGKVATQHHGVIDGVPIPCLLRENPIAAGPIVASCVCGVGDRWRPKSFVCWTSSIYRDFNIVGVVLVGVFYIVTFGADGDCLLLLTELVSFGNYAKHGFHK